MYAFDNDKLENNMKNFYILLIVIIWIIMLSNYSSYVNPFLPDYTKMFLIFNTIMAGFAIIVMTLNVNPRALMVELKRTE